MPEKYDAFEKKGELWAPKEERGHVRSAEEVEKARESIPKEKRIESEEERPKKAEAEKARKEEEWKYGSRTLERMTRELDEQKKEIESAEIPEKGMKTEDILKGAGIQPPAESFEEFEKRLKELDQAKDSLTGERPLSEGEKLVRKRGEYLKELGYTVKYKGVLLDKAEIWDENNKTIVDKKGKPIEFKSFYTRKTERQINDFLKEKLKEKLERKPAKEIAEEEKWEAGFQQTIRTTEQQQKRREEEEQIPEDLIESSRKETKSLTKNTGNMFKKWKILKFLERGEGR